jgi:hypothetical protein
MIGDGHVKFRPTQIRDDSGGNGVKADARLLYLPAISRREFPNPD